ncbi:DNA/RNA helicase domain-containing protein [Fluviicola sp.]|uniref:DNA/RNA helicase domain-containing protein n=1 Tax=Fluviicola sp. TaxID=1917219 RepID=UPI003D2BC681
MKHNFTICHYNFNSELESEIIHNHREFLSWPLVYFLNDKVSKDAYVGETTDVLKRLSTHSKTKNLSSVNIILSELFNKSATLDIESNLIRYISADGHYTLQNGNLGIANHRYYQQKEIYWDLFKDIWGELRQLGITRHSLEHIDNSDLFKYSPYKSLSVEQVTGLKMILLCLLDDNSKVSLIQGGAGTGKSILAIFLFKLLKTNLEDFNFSDFEEEDEELFNLVKQVKEKYGDLAMALVIPMASFRKTISNVFRNVKGLHPNMVIGPSDLAKKKYDLVIVDEGHRLRRRVNLGPYFSTFDKNAEIFNLDKTTSSELDWVLRQSQKALIFYDRFQSIKPSDVTRERFKELERHPDTQIKTLKTQFRCKGGDQYIELVYNLFSDDHSQTKAFQSKHYECYLFHDIQNMVTEIHRKEKADGLSRMIAGYAWEWISKTNKHAFDIVIGETQLRWNSKAIDWINSDESKYEIGCIHTTQGYDLNYAGIIIGPELDYDFETNKLVIYKDRYKDKAGKNTINDETVLKEYILNIYTTILLRGIKGTFIYACNENLRKHLAQFIEIKDLEKEKSQLKILDQPNERTVPFYDLQVAAGTFSNPQQVENLQFIDLETPLANAENYFACKVVGESMNQIIPNGSICLFEKYSGGSRNGLITLVEMTDYTDPDLGSNYTIKEYSSKKTNSADGWKHEEIVLLPRSTDSYESIVLRDEETVGLKVVGVFVRVLENLN